MMMKALILSIFVISFLTVSNSNELTEDVAITSNVEINIKPEDGILNMFFLVNKYGYPLKTYTVKTADGYLLKLHRIPHGRKCKVADKNKKPVLLMHGLLCSSYDFVVMGPSKSLAYLLADKCYDVWIGNNRGNSESQKHTNYTISNPKFWEFSFHEMGKYDLPAIIDFILRTTKQPSLHYVGHSQGTTQFFIFNSLYPKYTEKVRTMHALSPVVFLKHIDNIFIKLLVPFRNQLKFFLDLIGWHDLNGVSKLINLAGFMFCGDSSKINLVKDLCFNVPFFIGGFDPMQLNSTILPAIYGHFPAGGSIKQLVHFAQLIKSGHFRQYDYGFSKNLKIYKSIAPPDYDLSKVTAPIAMYYAENDWLSSIKDYRTLLSKLPNVISKYKVPFSKFNHIDYLWSTDIKHLLNDEIIEILEKYP